MSEEPTVKRKGTKRDLDGLEMAPAPEPEPDDNEDLTQPPAPAPGPDDEPQLPPAPAPVEYDDEPLTEPEDLENLGMAPPEVPQGPGPSQVQTRGKKADGDVPDGNDAASSVSDASTATNFTDASQASIASIASSVDQLPLPDAELMLFEVAEGVHRLTVAGMNWFNMVAERAGGYGPIASIAFISLLSANPNLLPTPTLSLPTIDLTGIASQIGLTTAVAANAAAAAAPAAANAAAAAAPAAANAAPTDFFSSLTGAATSATTLIGNGIMAGVTAIVAAIGTNQVVANPLTIDNIAGMVESVGDTAIGAVITVAEFQSRMVTSFKKLKANWTVQNLSVEGISIRQNENIDALVARAVEAHGQVLAQGNGVPRMDVTELGNMYRVIINDINNVASTEQVPAIAEGENVEEIRDEAANALIARAAGAGRNSRGGKKNRKSQKKHRKKVTRSKRGKKAARKTKKQSRRKSRGKKH
jgi:hypothetical protein